MATVDNRTPVLDLPLPYIDNDLTEDVQRLRDALTAIDTFANIGTIAKANQLATARNINGVSFDGTANITITAAANGGTSAACSGNSATATKLATPRAINGVNFDGSAAITITAAANGGTSAACSGNAATATKLATARNINGVSFDGTANITIADDTKLPSNGTAAAALKLATARNINGVAFDGTADVTIPGSDATKLPTAGGVITGTTDSTSATTGSLQVRGGLGVSKDIYAAGNITAYSDKRLKKDIEPISDALRKVAKLRGVNFTDIASGQRRTGVIAQEVQAVLPEAVVQNGDYLAVAYGNLTGLLIQAVNELAETVSKLPGSRKAARNGPTS